MDSTSLVDYAKSLDCVHCGLCLNTCPTYQLTGREAASPRGRIHLMRSVAEGTLAADAEFAEELDFCLLCRHCESVCPSGVHYGSMLEHTRAALEPTRARPWTQQVARKVGFDVILRDRWLLRIAAVGARWADRAGFARWIGAPALPARIERKLLPTHLPAQGPALGSVAMLEGCVMPEWMGHVQSATAQLLQRAGYHVRVSPNHVCCGSLHAHNGEKRGAQQLARETIEAYERITDDAGQPLPLVINSAGCGSHLKELDALFAPEDPWRARARALAQRCYDLSEWLCQPLALERLQAQVQRHRARQEFGSCAWDDPCHLCHGQGIRSQPRQLLQAVLNETLAPLANPEACCGSAGIYSLLRPKDSKAVLQPRIEALQASGAQTLITSNPGCMLQWEAGIRERGLRVRVRHLAEVLEFATRP